MMQSQSDPNLSLKFCRNLRLGWGFWRIWWQFYSCSHFNQTWLTARPGSDCIRRKHYQQIFSQSKDGHFLKRLQSDRIKDWLRQDGDSWPSCGGHCCFQQSLASKAVCAMDSAVWWMKLRQRSQLQVWEASSGLRSYQVLWVQSVAEGSLQLGHSKLKQLAKCLKAHPWALSCKEHLSPVVSLGYRHLIVCEWWIAAYCQAS